MKKSKRLAALCAAFFMNLCLCAAAHAEEAPAGSASSDPAGSVLPVRHQGR